MKGDKIKHWSLKQKDGVIHLSVVNYVRVVTSEEEAHGKLDCVNIFI